MFSPIRLRDKLFLSNQDMTFTSLFRKQNRAAQTSTLNWYTNQDNGDNQWLFFSHIIINETIAKQVTEIDSISKSNCANNTLIPLKSIQNCGYKIAQGFLPLNLYLRTQYNYKKKKQFKVHPSE